MKRSKTTERKSDGFAEFQPHAIQLKINKMNPLSKTFFSKIFIVLIALMALSPLAVNNTHAACDNDGTCDYKDGEDIFNCKADCLGPGVPTKSVKDAIYDTTDWILGFATAISVLMLVFGGLYYVMSTGNQEQITTAKKIIQYSLYGLIVVGISYALIVVISTVII